jgi:protein archease
LSYRYLPHTADLRVELTAPTLDALFGEATELARTLTAGETVDVRSTAARHVSLAAVDPAELLFAYLRALLYLHATERFVPARMRLGRLDATGLEADVYGESFDPARHEAQPEVKAVTRHGLYVVRAPTGWRAEVVLDL